MCRSELYWQYLSTEREKISAILDRHAGIISSDSRIDNHEIDAQTGDDDVSCTPTNAENVTPVPPTQNNRQRASLEPQDKADASTEPDPPEHPNDQNEVYSRIAKRSALCAELTQIVEQVTSYGRVNVKVTLAYSISIQCI